MKTCCTIALLLNTILSLHASVSLPALFSEHMVLQQAEKVPVWGKADPGEKVTVTLANATAETVARVDGKWMTALNLSKVGEGPFTMVVEGQNRLEIPDVLVGQVWVCSGQSNMEFPLKRAIGAETEIANSANDRLRYFSVPRSTQDTPSEALRSSWVIAGPATSQRILAVAYYFGKTIQKQLNTPVGLIGAAVGATPSEAWTSYESLSTDPEIKAGADKLVTDAKNYPATKKTFTEQYAAWTKTNQREDRPTENLEAFTLMGDRTGWKQISLPGRTVDQGLPDAGAVWFVKSFDINEANSGKDFKVSLGTINGWETVYWNGERLGGRNSTSFRGANETSFFTVPATSVKLGKNFLAVRVFNPIGELSFSGKLSQAGDWAAKTEFELPSVSPDIGRNYPTAPNLPPDPKTMGAVLFNGMIHPLIPYAIKGAIWYQGENNAERAVQYRKAFPLLISDWRKQWGQGNFPFYFCQLANFNAKKEQPGDDSWAELREAQTLTLATPNTGQAILIDIGEAGDIHPCNKEDVGKRLAALALAKTYGQNIPFTGPAYNSMKVEGNKIRITFKGIDGGLVARPLGPDYLVSTVSNKRLPLVRNSPRSQLEGFAICGSNHQWFWADDAHIDGDAVVVSSASVPEPVAVRYAWAKNPTCNLYNGAGFPAGPFRTDDFPLTTNPARY